MKTLKDFPMVRDTEDWIIDAWLISTDGPYRLYIFDQEDGTYSLTWYDSRQPGYEIAYQDMYKGPLLSCLLTLDSLTRFPGITDHSRSIIYVRHDFKMPVNITIKDHIKDHICG